MTRVTRTQARDFLAAGAELHAPPVSEFAQRMARTIARPKARNIYVVKVLVIDDTARTLTHFVTAAMNKTAAERIVRDHLGDEGNFTVTGVERKNNPWIAFTGAED